MEIDSRKVAKLVREANIHHDEYDASMERTLKTNAKVASNQKLYLDGYSKGLKGVPLESFTDLVEENGKIIQRKDHRNFKAGYARGQQELENQMSLNTAHKTR